MPTAAEEIARLLRLEWQAYMRGMRAILEANTLRSEHEPREASLRDALSRVATLDRELEGARARIATLEEHLVQARDRMAKQDAQLRALHSTRRYRLAGVMAAPFDALRARLR
jgi:predicted RNase H-like nuclease